MRFAQKSSLTRFFRIFKLVRPHVETDIDLPHAKWENWKNEVKRPINLDRSVILTTYIEIRIYKFVRPPLDLDIN